MLRRTLIGCLMLLLSSTSVQAASPQLSLILPRGCQRGAEHEISFRGARLADAQEIFFYDSGFEVVKLEAEANQVKATIKVSPDCRLGEHAAQIRTASGISEFRTFYVGALPAADEKEPNSSFDEPQAIELNVTVEGTIQSEDVDYFVFDAKKGQRLSVEVEAMRLGGTLFDPYVAILDSKRFELVAVDDSPLARQDCLASVVAPEDGKYYIMIRESSYGGNGNCRYRAHIGTFPRPKAIYPAGGKVGETVDVRFIGDPAGELSQSVQVPSEPNDEYGLFATDNGGIAPSEIPFRIFEHGNVLEVEPNDAVAEASPAELPLAMNGIIEKEGDADFFKFTAKKGEVWEVECYARRIRSELDPVMNLYNANGGSITGNDDSRGPDSYFRFSVPADGEYAVRVTDHLGRGGPNFVYRVEFTPVKPALTLGIPRVRRYSQDRQQIFVARGNRFATLMTANRQNFSGELVLDGKGLPEGIKMICEPMPANMNQMPVVFEAAADAPLSGKLVDFTARHADPEQKIEGKFTNRADFIIGRPGQSLYRWKDVDVLPVAVVEELPFKLEIIEPQVPLVQEGSMQLKIVAHRQEGFNEAINVQLPFRPPGVGAASSVTIPAGQNEVLYPINASGNAQVKEWKIFALGSANVNGNAWVSSQLAKLEVSEPFVKFALERSSCEQGKDTQVYGTITVAKPFEGTAKAQLLGLPAKVTTEDLEFTKDTKELIFPIKTEESSPAGKHKNLLAQVTITMNGEPIVSRGGTVELQIDKPLPPPKNEPKPEPKPQVAEKKEEPKPPTEKPLSRLEKLRLAAQERAAAGSGGGSEE